MTQYTPNECKVDGSRAGSANGCESSLGVADWLGAAVSRTGGVSLGRRLWSCDFVFSPPVPGCELGRPEFFEPSSAGARLAIGPASSGKAIRRSNGSDLIESRTSIPAQS